MFSTPRPRGQLVQALTCVVTAVALIAVSSCAAEAPAPRAAPTTTEAPAPPTTTETPPEEPTACTDPASENLGDGFFERDGLVYETTADGCMYRPGTPEATTLAAELFDEHAAELRRAIAEPAQAFAPRLAVDPVTATTGLTTFTLEGSGFDPSLTAWTLLCPLDPDLSEDSPEEELSAAMSAVTEADCDLDSAQEAEIADDGTLSVQRDVMVNPQNFMWVASNAGQTQVAAAAVFVEEPQQATTAVASATEPAVAEPETTDEPTSTTSTPPDASAGPEAVEPEPEPATTTKPPEREPEPEPEPTVTTTPPEPEPEPEPESEPVQEVAPTLVVAPDAVSEGLNTFKLEGAGFDPGTAAWTLLCALDGSLTVDTPTEQVAAAVAAVERSDCDMASAQAVDVDADGSFTDTRDATVRANFVWVASDAAETRTAAAAVIMSRWPHGPPGTIVNIAQIWPDDGYAPDFVCVVNADGHFVDSDGNQHCWHTSADCDVDDPARFGVCWQSDEPWTPPQAGDVPAVHPDTPQFVGDQPDDVYGTPRETPQVAGWKEWCSRRMPGCGVLLNRMYQALDYLGANEQCVLKAYSQRVDYLVEQGSRASGNYATNAYGWHVCATVIDPIVVDIPAGDRDNDIGLRLSDTPGITLAERCRVVLVGPFPDIELESRWGAFDEPPERFGQDCDAWAESRMTRNLWQGSPACAASSYLAEEWMEYARGQHERHFAPRC